MRSTRPAARRPAKRYSALTPTARASNSVVSCGFPRVASPSTARRRTAKLRLSDHVYQRSHGGKTFCPLERDGRIVVTSTPRFREGDFA